MEQLIAVPIPQASQDSAAAQSEEVDEEEDGENDSDAEDEDPQTSGDKPTDSEALSADPKSVLKREFQIKLRTGLYRLLCRLSLESGQCMDLQVQSKELYGWIVFVFFWTDSLDLVALSLFAEVQAHWKSALALLQAPMSSLPSSIQSNQLQTRVVLLNRLGMRRELMADVETVRLKSGQSSSKQVRD